MNNEVEEFLRRAAQRRAQVESQLRAQAEARARGQGQVPPQREPPKRLTPVAQSISQPQVAELAVTGDRVTASVAEHMRHTQEIAAHVEQLGDRVETADEEMEAHLRQTFDHSVGRLQKTTEGPAQLTPGGPSVPATVRQDVGAAQGIAQLLRSPLSVRNAIILAEVLNRPTDRW
jgi:enoyl-CoA hydratase/carnithine racemase